MKVLVDTQQGFAFITVFTAKELLEGEVPVYRVWEMGDGTTYEDVPDIQHIYKYAGIYTIQYSILDSKGIKYFVTFDVSIKFAVRDAIIFSQIPELYADPGQPSDIFTVSVTSTQIDKPINVSLFAVNSNSIPAQVIDSKWERLVPRWRFVEAQKNELKGEYTAITDIDAHTTPITALNTLNGVVTCAIKGDVSFRFIDDTSTGILHKSLPLLLNATLQTSSFTSPRDSQIYDYESFANSSVISTTVAWQVNYIQPSFLKITSNVYENITYLNWNNTSIPFIITAHVAPTYLTLKQNTGISYTYPSVSAETAVELLVSQDNLIFSSIDKDKYTITPNNLAFSAFDSQSVKTGGYVFGSLQTPLTSAYAKIRAFTSAINVDYNDYRAKREFIYPLEYTPTPIAYICNPLESSVTKLHITPLTFLTEKNLNGSIVGTVKTYNTSITANYSDVYNYRVPYESGTYCVAVDPRDESAPYSSVVVDASKDIIYRLKTGSSNGVEFSQTSSVHLSSFSNFNTKTQNVNTASISLDSRSNAWLSLNNFPEVLKLDQNFNLLIKVSLPQDLIISTGVSSIPVDESSDDCHCHCLGDTGGTDTSSVVYETGDYSVRSKVLETDQQDNVWVGCIVPNGSVILKFNSNGEQLLRYDLPIFATINSFTIDYDNNLWATYHTSTENHGNSVLIKLSTTAELLTTVNLNQKYATYLCVDRQSNIWYVHSGRSFGFINTHNYNLISWDIDVTGEVTLTPLNALKTSNLNNDFNSITVDAFDRLWIIDSTHNNVYCFSTYTQLLTSIDAPKLSVRIYPDSKNHRYITYTNTVSTIYNPEGKNIYAVGDFTGNKWLQKYGNNSSGVITLTGESTVFSIQDLYNNGVQIRKINENFNMTEYFKTLAITDAFLSYNDLYSDIFKAVAGDNTTLKNNLGLRIYEKIANFSINTTDVDTCEIQHLVSLATMTGNKILKTDKDIPVGIKRLLDITSISHKKLLGSIVPSEDLLESSYTTNVFLEQESTNFDIMSSTEFVAFVSNEDSSITIKKIEPVNIIRFGEVVTLSSYPLHTFFTLNSSVSTEFKTYILENDSINSNILFRLKHTDMIRSGNNMLIVDKQTSEKSLVNIPLSSYLHSDETTIEYISSIPFSELYDYQRGCYYYDKYYCYTYALPSKSISESIHYNNIVDWNNPYNTINYQSLKESKDLWYGAGGIIESAFNNILTRYLTVTSELVE